MSFELFWEFDFLFGMFFCVLMSHFNHCIGAIDLHPAVLPCGSSCSGPWRALDFANEEVIVFLLFDLFLRLLIDSESNGFHFDEWARDFAISPVDSGVKGSEPWVPKDEGAIVSNGHAFSMGEMGNSGGCAGLWLIFDIWQVAHPLMYSVTKVFMLGHQ